MYRGEHVYLPNRVVAIKVLNTEALNDPSARNRFFQEAQFLGMLKHRHILPIVDISILNDVPYLITEYATEGSLKERIYPRTPMALQEGLKILVQIGEALQYIHDFTHEKHIIHRDLKPANILFNENDEALLADFGIATMLNNAGIKQGTIIGTYAYMAPEQFKGIVSVKSDQYSLGCISYEIFTGRKPFVSTSDDPNDWAHLHLHKQPVPPTEYNNNLPLYIEQAILRAMSKQADERFYDVSAFVRELDVDDSVANMGTMIVQLPLTPINLPPVVSETDKQQRMKEGSDHYKAKRYEEALEAYKQIILIDPGFLHAYILQGSVLSTMGRYEEALAVYAQAIKLDENSASAYNGKGNALSNLERYEEALKAYEQVIKLNTNFASVHDSKGNVLGKLKRNEEALAAYQEAILRNSNNAMFYKHKGDVLFQLERAEEALVAYEQAIKIQIDFASVYLSKGDVLFHLKRYEEALAAYEKALQFDTNLVNAYMGQGNALKLLDRNLEALTAYEQALLFMPDLSVAYFEKGEAFSNLKLYTSALAAYEQAIKLTPSTTSAYLKKGLVLCNIKRYEEALAVYEQAIAINANDAFSYEQKGAVLSYLNRHQEALNAYEQAIRLNPHSSAAYNSKGLTLWNLGRQQEAFAAFEQAEKIIQRSLDSQGA